MEAESGPDRSEVVQLTGAKLARERKRTIALAQELPRGIRIGDRRDGRPKPFFVRWGHPRKTESFATEQARNDRAVQLRDAKEEHGAAVMRFDPAEWAEFQAWRAERAKRRLGLTVRTAVAEYLTLRQAEGLAGDSLRHTKTYLGRFADQFGALTLAAVGAEHVRVWLEHLRETRRLAPASLRHHRKDLNVFLNRAVAEKWLADNPCKTVKPPRLAVKDEVATMGLREAFAFFKANRDQRAVGRLALEAFAGLRHSSAQRIGAADLNPAERAINLHASQHKSGRRHYLDGWPANLWRWLAHAPADCWTLTGRNYGSHKAMAFARAGLTNPGNVFRHTFATCHLAAFRDGPALARLMQHRNLSMLYGHYLGRGVSQPAGRAFFLITPRTVRLSFDRFCRLAGLPAPAPTP